MIKNKVTAFAITVAMSVTLLSSYSSSGLAQSTNPAAISGAQQGTLVYDNHSNQYCHHHRYHGHYHGHKRRGHYPFFPLWDLGLMQHKNLSVENARTITEAALLMSNRKDLTVGTINGQTVRGTTFYTIQIDDVKGNVVSTAMMNADTGFIRPKPEIAAINAALPQSAQSVQ